MQCARCFPSKRRERKKMKIHKRKMRIHLGIKPLAHRSGCFPGPKWSIFNKRYQLDERELCQPESQIQPIFAIPFCQELSFQQKGYQIKSIQTKNPKHRTLQQVMNASFGWKIVIRTNEQRTQRKERFLKKPTCKPKAWVRKSAKWNANFGGRLEITQNIEKAKRNRGFLNKNSSG